MKFLPKSCQNREATVLNGCSPAKARPSPASIPSPSVILFIMFSISLIQHQDPSPITPRKAVIPWTTLLSGVPQIQSTGHEIHLEPLLSLAPRRSPHLFPIASGAETADGDDYTSLLTSSSASEAIPEITPKQ